ncbi:prenyltransferase/squalene oxidase repeat-containing protein [Streptomyces sp. NPDC002054]|uniref:prenyltransferase/squalene oxidase repeat-containing protein n=1 Tax=Streptomyces sp. NPDC002054 TaxID=3154663 RepID=UPI00333174B7
MNVRRSAAALAASAVLCTLAAPTALATPSPAPASPSPVIPSGLYGTGDPTFDGVFRQSLAFLAQHTAGVHPAPKAVDWLVGQQCANGAFASFRPDTTKACDASTTLDSNATAAAVQALAALGGHEQQVKKAVGWLKSVQNDNGGWSYSPGGTMDFGTDANSTGIVAGALTAAGEQPDAVKSKAGKTAYDALRGLQLACVQEGVSKPEELGAFASQPDKATGKLPANPDATAAAVLGVLGKGLVVTAPAADKPVDPKAVTCEAGGAKDPAQSAAGGAGYLSTKLAASGDHLMSTMPGATDQPDFGNTADAVLALAAAGHKSAAAKPLAWLEKNAADWAKTAGPGAYAQLILAAHAGGANPKAFGGTDLVAALNAQGPAPQAAPTKATGGMPNSDSSDSDSSSGTVWWFVGACAAAGVGIGILLSGRRKKQQP